MVDWNHLSVDLLEVIAEKLDSYHEYVKFRSLCPEWYNTLSKRLREQKLLQVPWLILPYDDDTQTIRGFYNFLENKTYHFELPEARGKWFRGSSYGWLITLDKGEEVSLLNPFTKLQIILPSLSSFPFVQDYNPNRFEQEFIIVTPTGVLRRSKNVVHRICLRKVVLSNSPSDGAFMAVAISGLFSDLAFYRHGDTCWSKVITDLNWFYDVIFKEGKIYAITGRGHLIMVDPELSLKAIEISVELPVQTPSQSFSFVGALSYIVDGGDNKLIMLVRSFDFPEDEYDPSYKTCKIKIYEKNLTSQNEGWVETEDIQDKVVFIGLNSSFMDSPSNYSQHKGDLIYYCDNNLESHSEEFGSKDIGILNVQNESNQEISFDEYLNSNFTNASPIWIVSNFS